VIRETLTRFVLTPAYADEQRDLQPHIKRVIEESLRQSFPGAALLTTMSVGGVGKPHLNLLGTSAWPDVAITEDGKDLVAIEVKLIHAGKSAARAIAEGIGQSVIYSVRYPHVFMLLVHGVRVPKTLTPPFPEILAP
jgi:hypothetical protein